MSNNWKENLPFSVSMKLYVYGLDYAEVSQGATSDYCIWTDSLTGEWGHLEIDKATRYSRSRKEHEYLNEIPYRRNVITAFRNVPVVRQIMNEALQDWGGCGMINKGPHIEGWQCKRFPEDSDQHGSSYSAVRYVWRYVPDIEGLTEEDRRNLQKLV